VSSSSGSSSISWQREEVIAACITWRLKTALKTESSLLADIETIEYRRETFSCVKFSYFDNDKLRRHAETNSSQNTILTQ